MDQQLVHNCIIIGSGPAGYTAAIYAARANLSPILFQGMQPGGQLTITTEVENYPGFANGVKGPEMMQIFEEQARRMGTKIIFDTITKVDFSSPIHKVWDGNNQIHLARTVIISTGASAKWLGIESEQRLNGSGVSACAVCDGFFFRGKEVSIVGGGDTACEEALYLSKLSPKVHMFIRGDQMRASQVMQQRVIGAENIITYFNTEVVEIVGEKKVECVEIRNKKTQTNQTIKVDALFVAIGHQPNSDLFKGQVKMDEHGYIETTAGSSKTNVKGVFACGDVQDKNYRQAITAAGSGCMAAIDAERYINS